MNDISLFDFIDELEPEDIQKEVVAADLSMLLVHSNYNRTQLGTDLGYKKSRISRILSGDENLTLKTLTKVADALGYTFDVVFYNDSYPKPKQPWTIDRENKAIRAESVHLEHSIELKLQEVEEVFEDLLTGKDASYYISVNQILDIEKTRSLQPTRNISISKSGFRLDTATSKSYSFFSSLENKDKEQCMTI